MERAYKRLLLASSKANGSMSRCRRDLSATIPLQAAKHAKSAKHAKPAKPKPPKAVPKITSKESQPKYKPSTPKQVPKPLSTPKPKANPFRNRVIPMYFGGLIVLVLSGYMTYFYITITRDDGKPARITPASQQDVSTQYDKIATIFDDTVDSMEKSLGITSLRRKLASEAVGDVLEVSIGTGRNLEFYQWDFKGYQGVGKVDTTGHIKKGKVRSFTAVDKSGEMLEIAHEKFGKMFPGILGVRWVIADATEPGAIPGPPKSANERSGNLDSKYDTVVQTMGLCSVSDPVKLLKNLGECVKEEEGRILLLEHGRGSWALLNKALDKSAEGHAEAFGCWWNRDIRQIVEESGLKIVKIEQPKWWHAGTTWWVELRKPKSKSAVKESEKEQQVAPHVLAVDAEGKEKQAPTTSREPKKKGWW